MSGGNVLNKFRKFGKGGGGGHSTKKKKKRSNELRAWEQQGAWRRDESGTHWWLSAEQLIKLRELNDQCEDNDEGDRKFWQLFREFREDEGITRNDRVGRIDTGIKGNWWDYKPTTKKYSWEDPLASKGSMSEWWTGYGKSTWVSKDKAAKIAIAMAAVEDTVRVTDDSGTRCVVVPHTSGDRAVSFTDLNRNRITVSAKPILDGKLSDGEAMDVMTGFGLHEASHSKKDGTRKYIRELERNKDKIKPLAVGAHLFNIIEDNRIEMGTKDDFPGFTGYFDACMRYMWDEGKGERPIEYGPDLTSKLNCVVGFLRWPNEFATEIVFTPTMTEERKWWTEWQERYDPDTNLIKTLVEGIAHLRNATEQEESAGEGTPDERAESGTGGGASGEMDAQEQKEEELRKLGDALDEIMKEFRERMKGLSNPCSHQHDPEGAVSAKTAETVQNLRDEKLERHQPTILTEDGQGNPTIYVSKPTETEQSKAAYDSRPDPMLSKYKAALLFRDDVPTDSLKLSREGTIDEDELFRWAADDWRVFQQKEERRETNARVYLLVDMSGSMSGWGGSSKIEAAQRISRLFAEALTSMHGVNPKIYGHTGDTGAYDTGRHEGTSMIYRLWEPGDPMTRLGLIRTISHGNNYDGHAIEFVAKEMISDTQGDEQLILIVLSDGIPAGSDYGGDQGMAHVRKVVGDATRKGIRVLQIAIDPELDNERQSAMFDEFIPYVPGTSMDAVPRKLTAWLAKAL